MQLLLAEIYHNQRQFKKALNICQSLSELPENTLDEGCRFVLDTKIWTIMLEINNPNAEFYLNRIKKSPLLFQHDFLCVLVCEAHKTHGTIMGNSAGGHFRIDTQFMEEALLVLDPSKNPTTALMYAWLHGMNNKTLSAIEWAERSLAIHKETQVGVETVTMLELIILAFLALKEYERGSIDKSEEYAKRALVINFQIEAKPPTQRANMYGLLSCIYGKRGNKRMADAFRTKEKKYRGLSP